MGLLSTIGAASGRAFGLTRVGAAIRDAYFNLTTLLLPGNGTNGAQNNTFLDSSTNNFSITRNGNTTQGTFSPFSQTGWSNYFDGAGDYLVTPSSANLAMGSGDITVECWFYALPSANQHWIFDFRTSGSESTTRLYAFIHETTNVLNIGFGTFDDQNAGTPAKNTWNHLAIVRSGSSTNNVSVYLNGSRNLQLTDTTNLSTNTQVRVGRRYIETNSIQYMNGYIAGLRALKGTAQYSGSPMSPSVPTAPLTAITNTSLLTCQSNRFIDNSTNAFTITVNDSPSVQAFSPFAPTAAYSAATVGGSGYFDGTGDYLQIAANSAFQFDADFTVECWFYSGTSTTANKYDQIIGTIESANAGYWRLGSEFNGGKQFWFTWTTGSYNDILTSFSVSDNAWHHLAVSRISNSVRLFVDGVQRGSTTTVTTNLNANAPLMIMNSTQGTNQTQGYVSSARIIKGQGLYNGTFTPPTAPFTTSSVGSTGSGAASSITGTVSILTNFTNAAITDATAKNDLETVGNAQISTTVSKFGSGSMSFDGTGDYLLLPHTVDQMLGTGAFTIEMWIYRNASGTYGLVGKGTGTTGWLVSLNSSNQVVFTYGSSTITSTGTISATTWTYIAVVREGTGTNQTKIYISGSNDGTGTVSTDFNQTNAMYVGADRTGGSNYNGYIDDLRITKGFARTIATPSSAFALQ